MEAREDILTQTHEEVDQNTAVKILINAVYLGQSRGAWKLEECETLLKAIRAFTKK